MSPPPAPYIPPLASGTTRPFWSVMIPVYNRVQYLEETLRSVLREDPGVEAMEIVVVDDHSTEADVEEITNRVGGGRIKFVRQKYNLGLTRNFNNCIERATGEWVHILHSDDYVCPGFYKRAGEIAAEKQVSAICFRSYNVTSSGEVMHATKDLSGAEGMQELREILKSKNPVQCPGVVVTREVYERLGGFRTHLCQLTDLEMWSRVFFNVPTYFSGEILACFRYHSEKATVTLTEQGANLRDQFLLLPYLRDTLKMSVAEVKEYRRRNLMRAYHQCAALARAKKWRAWKQNQGVFWSVAENPLEKMQAGMKAVENFWRIFRATIV